MPQIYHFNRLFPNNSLYKEDERILNHILMMIQNKENLDIRNIALQNYTSASSISRLAKRAGFNNFKELLFFLSTTGRPSLENQLEPLPFAHSDTNWEDICRQLKLALASRSIFLYGEGFCQFLVSYTYRKLLLKKVYAVDLDGVEIKTVSDEQPHTLITFSHSGENKRGLRKMSECREQGDCVIAITASPNSRYSQESDFCIVVDNQATITDYENQHLNFFFGNTLNLMEYLIDICT
ncbi:MULTISPECIES: MurR/RpiR family transcriptional regulator [Streptococcus]|uniref:MurR/RpiR family transcriptional regulator n=1 Tax=Streptococcus acidominimus TaxID=1326 RepID=A0A1Q8EC67_STRAI|nr:MULTISPECIES: SIS domain-containing protein [Streptococcus]MBF0848267.1 MurR/RpiR family transcriptional regulator [Streptococcus danieliae]MCQ9211289.1 SIS domain-containing protein [Streptococcus sp. B01]MCQ9214601.1 SIS domain-containing protein [Streptococcus sp. O1]MBF0787925.1 MurR/RpiR family transcriptional regulator [Streptococcus sp. 19428wC2_LYSM12]MBF0817974.1 MurR/RpiR family transcriptional regulator [Streptococcus acidominimus]